MDNTFTTHDYDRLRQNTLVEEIVYLEEVDSTNNYAKNLGGSATTLVLCGKQVAGRGRGEHVWQAPEGSLAFSLRVGVEALQLHQQHWPLISLFTAIALARSLSAWVPDGCVGLKWPNDVMLNRRKTAGILLEASADKSAVIIGVGVNFSNDVEALQGELDQPATSLASVMKSDGMPSPTALIEKFLQEWDVVRKKLLEEGLPIQELWNPFGILSGLQVTLNVSGLQKTGLCKGLATDGALLLETSTGEERFYSGTGLRVLS